MRFLLFLSCCPWWLAAVNVELCRTRLDPSADGPLARCATFAAARLKGLDIVIVGACLVRRAAAARGFRDDVLTLLRAMMAVMAVSLERYDVGRLAAGDTWGVVAVAIAVGSALVFVRRRPGAFFSSCGGESGAATALVYGAYVALAARDATGVFRFNMTKRPAASMTKPHGYASRVLRRPLWCPPCLLRLLANDRVQAAAFYGAAVGAACCAASGADAPPGARVAVALCHTVVELKFCGATGWHRGSLLTATLWASALPAPHRKTARVLALVHAYGGSGAARLRVGGPPDGAALRAVLDGAVASGNGLYLAATRALAAAPTAALLAFDAASRVGFEVCGTAALLARRDDARARAAFRAAAIVFHASVAALTAIDFFESRVVLVVALVCDDLLSPAAPFRGIGAERGGDAEAAGCGPARLFALALLAPVLAGVEHYPFTHGGLFPYSGTQAAAIKATLGDRNRLVAVVETDPAAPEVDLAKTFLGLSDSQPAQIWHGRLFDAFLTVVKADPADADATAAAYAAARADLAVWLRRNAPLVDAASGATYDTVIKRGAKLRRT